MTKRESVLPQNREPKVNHKNCKANTAQETTITRSFKLILQLLPSMERKEKWKTKHCRINSDHKKYHPALPESLIRHALADILSERRELIDHLRTNKSGFVFRFFSTSKLMHILKRPL